MTEEEIYEGCKRGDATARRELYTCFSGTMLAIGIRYLADRDEAEDLLHDVFVNVLTNFHKFSYKGEGSLRAWMKRVMVNAALDRLRRNKHAESTDIESVGDIPGRSPTLAGCRRQRFFAWSHRCPMVTERCSTCMHSTATAIRRLLRGWA